MFRRGESAPANSALRQDNFRFIDSRQPFRLNAGQGQRQSFAGKARRTGCNERPRESRGIQGGTMLDFVQQLVSGVALGCVYGLIALGFVLVYKATEVVNFAQGDLMMLGGFFAFTFIGILGLNYWIGFVG